MDKERWKTNYRATEDRADGILHRIANFLDDLADSEYTVVIIAVAIMGAIFLYFLLR